MVYGGKEGGGLSQHSYVAGSSVVCEDMQYDIMSARGYIELIKFHPHPPFSFHGFREPHSRARPGQARSGLPGNQADVGSPRSA